MSPYQLQQAFLQDSVGQFLKAHAAGLPTEELINYMHRSYEGLKEAGAVSETDRLLEESRDIPF